jgi:osmotically-inducible protein OsmY
VAAGRRGGRPGGRRAGPLGPAASLLPADDEIRDEVADEVLGRILLVDPHRVAIDVDRGVVTLTGDLDIRADAQMAVRFVERIEGVVAVIDRLTYRYDERLADRNIAPMG